MAWEALCSCAAEIARALQGLGACHRLPVLIADGDRDRALACLLGVGFEICTRSSLAPEAIRLTPFQEKGRRICSSVSLCERCDQGTVKSRVEQRRVKREGPCSLSLLRSKSYLCIDLLAISPGCSEALEGRAILEAGLGESLV